MLYIILAVIIILAAAALYLGRKEIQRIEASFATALGDTCQALVLCSLDREKTTHAKIDQIEARLLQSVAQTAHRAEKASETAKDVLLNDATLLHNRVAELQEQALAHHDTVHGRVEAAEASLLQSLEAFVQRAEAASASVVQKIDEAAGKLDSQADTIRTHAQKLNDEAHATSLSLRAPRSAARLPR
jgi:hypothetical protein